MSSEPWGVHALVLLAAWASQSYRRVRYGSWKSAVSELILQTFPSGDVNPLDDRVHGCTSFCVLYTPAPPRPPPPPTHTHARDSHTVRTRLRKLKNSRFVI